ncbi:MAG: addiction module protein [Deltaproteobacteria bacterium]|nr:addiction module protein [Deltaproteobacteria bacterium]
MTQTPVPEPPGFADLSKADQIHYLQALWDRISRGPEEVPVPPSHVDLAETRLRERRQSPDRAKSAYDVLDLLGTRKR